MGNYKLLGPKWGASAQHGTSGGTITWSFATTNYYDQPFSYDQPILSATQRATIRNAFAAWEAVCNVNFVEVSDSASVDVRLGLDSIDGPSGTLAQCSVAWSDNTFVDAEIRFDTSDSNRDIYATALHEIGHALGLQHFDGAPSIMNTYSGSVRTLQPGDIAGARALYGYVPASLAGTTANEKFDLHTRTASLVVNAKSGNDFIWSGSGHDLLRGDDGRDIILGGAGNDRMTGDSAANPRTGAADQLLGGTGADMIWGGVGNDYVHGESDNDALYGGVGNDLIYGGFGNDALTGDAGNDVLWGATPQNLYGAWFGSPIHVTRNALNGAAINERRSSSGAVQATDTGADVLSGGSGNDTLVGGAGNDLLIGGTGLDRMIGGTGRDVFRFNSSLVGGNADSIVDFNVADDTIQLDNAVMAGLGSITGPLAEALFWANTAGAAHDASDRIVYDTDGGQLWYDSNGTAAGGRALIATLKAGLKLTAADFVII